MSDFRKVTIESLKKIYIDKSYSNIVINSQVKKIDDNLSRLYRKTVLGTIENTYFVDFVINEVSSTKINKLQNEVLMTLRLAVYQIFFLDNSKEFVVVNESVDYIKKKVNFGASKFVNGVLRNIIRKKQELINRVNSLERKEYLSVKYSYPKWLISKFIDIFGDDDIENILQKNNEEAKLILRTNTVKISRDELIERLQRANVDCKACEIADKGIVVDSINDLESLQEYKDGLFSIQSESSMLVGQVLNPKENCLIVDMCSAPGGKSLDCGERMKNLGKIISRDLYEHKVKLIENEAQRIGITNVVTQIYDGTILDESLAGKADYCIVDVPCSGLGIIRRKPEIKFNKEENTEELANIQFQILSCAAKYLKSGGELVYSTCTIDKKENIEIIKRFIKENKGYSLVNITKETKDKFDTSNEGYIEIYPHIHNLDGFFIAKIRKDVI